MSKYGKLSLAALTALVLAGSAYQARTAEPTAGGAWGPLVASQVLLLIARPFRPWPTGCRRR